MVQREIIGTREIFCTRSWYQLLTDVCLTISITLCFFIIFTNYLYKQESVAKNCAVVNTTRYIFNM